MSDRASRRTSRDGAGRLAERSPWWVRYVAAAALAGIALALTLVLRTFIQPSPFLLFYAAVTLSAWYGGLGPGILTSFAAVIALDYAFFPPYGLFSLGDAADVLQFALFLLVAALASGLSQSLRTARHRAELAAEQTRDANERIRALSRTLEERVDELQRVLELSPVGIAVARDPEARDVRANPAFAEMLGARPGENVSYGRPNADRIPFRLFIEGREARLAQLPMQRAVQAGRPVRDVEVEVRRRDGTERTLECSAVPLLDEHGRSRGAIGTFIDVTDRKRVARERQRLLVAERSARQIAETASRAKSDFLAVMSHELRTPLNAIIGYSRLMADRITGPVSDAQRGQLDRILASADHLLALINQILSLSRIEAGREELHAEDVDLAQLVRETAALVEPGATGKGLRFLTDIPDVPVPGRIDATKLRQIVLNILSNAVKYTDRGVVRITLTVEEDAFTVEVRDTGAGIAPEHLARIFEPFWQAERALARRTAGAGLGLSVSAELARLLGGEIGATSELGRGSTFTLRLPRYHAPAGPERGPVTGPDRTAA